jgi:branched-subunit amino acid ABC-type transport system permease component
MLVLATSATSWLQYGIDGFINGSSYGLLGLSFGIIVAVTGRFHFAWAAAYAIAGFFSAWLATQVGLPVVPSVVIAILGAIAFNLIAEVAIYRPIAARVGPEAALLGIFVGSFGITIAMENLITWVVGTNNSSETLTWISLSPLHIGQITITTLDVVTVIAVWGSAVLVWAMLKFAPLGRRIRAVQVNPEMAEAVGIDTGRTYLVVMALSASLGGVAAVLYSLKYAGTPTMGETPVFYAFVVAFAAGLGRSPLRIMVVGSLIGIVEGLSAGVLPIAWQQAVVFGILLIYLIGKAGRAWRPSLFTVPALLGSRS